MRTPARIAAFAERRLYLIGRPTALATDLAPRGPFQQLRHDGAVRTVAHTLEVPR